MVLIYFTGFGKALPDITQLTASLAITKRY